MLTPTYMVYYRLLTVGIEVAVDVQAVDYKHHRFQWTTVVNLKMKNIPETIIVAA